MGQQDQAASNGEYSAQSQRSLLRRDGLRAQLGKLTREEANLRTQIATFEEEKARSGKKALTDYSPRTQEILKQASENLTHKRDLLAACQEQSREIQAEIEQLIPSPTAQKTRADRQREFARLCAERLEGDHRADRELGDLCGSLMDRAALSTKMREYASVLELSTGQDQLDTRRFEDLAASLPVELSASSERWAARFLGKQKLVRSYVVREDRLVLPETLAESGMFYFGERVELTEEQATELLCEDGDAPPSLMTLEDFQSAGDEAEKAGVSIQEFCFWADIQREAAAREREKSQPRMVGGRNQKVAARKGNDFVSDLRIRATVKGTLQRNGRSYQKGDNIEVIGKHEARSLVDASIIGPPWEG
jgi:hypothetical protein